MFDRHVTNRLSAYCHGELPANEAARVSAHLERCARCRKEAEEIRLGIAFAERLPRVAAPEHLWAGIETRLAHSLAPSRPPRILLWKPAAILAAGLLLIVELTAVSRHVRHKRDQHPIGPSWEVARLAGAPEVDAERIGRKGRLAVGQWLVTDSASKAQIKVADIGRIEVEPNTRIRLVETRPNEHRLSLARGTMHAKVTAPPRLFLVDTPGATAVDLGCAYTLQVDNAGRSLLRVTLGWVSFERGGHESIVPADARCETRPLLGPGTPCFEDAPPAFQTALRQLDFEGGGEPALRAVLALARQRDTLTLWHLLSRVPESQRGLVYDRLKAFAAPPAGVTRDGVLKLDRQMLDDWKDKLRLDWWGSFPGLPLAGFQRWMNSQKAKH